MNDKPKVYRMLVHLFGATSSPSCANAALKQTAIDNKHKFGQAVTDVVLNNFYVDDCLVSTDSAAEASKLIKNITYLCSLGGFHLTKWTSSSTEVLQTIPVQERAKNIKPVVLDTQNLPVERALGIQWLLDSDTLGFSVSGKSYSATRRGILSAVSSVYDPLGIASPFVLVAKIVLQKLWGNNMEWDTPISEADSRRWSSWLKELPLLVDLQLRRCYKPDDFGEVTSTQLHYFSDASDKGYGVACYIRQTDNTGRVCCSLVLAKSRVAPVKRVTIPRMELTAATLSVRLYRLVERELKISVDNTYYWTDSMAIINYIWNESTRFPTFVANRLALIHELSTKDQWHFVGTTNNPTDIASRGQMMSKLLENKIWLRGPEFLYLPVEDWNTSQDLQSNYCEKGNGETETSTKEERNFTDSLISRFSNWTKLKRIVARILMVMNTLKEWVQERKLIQCHVQETEQDPIKQKTSMEQRLRKVTENRLQEGHRLKKSAVTYEALKAAENFILQHVQKRHFSEELNTLTKRPSDGVNTSSQVYKLDPFVRDGLLRVGGRLTRADVPYQSRHPILLPKSSPVSQLILTEVHKQIGHLGRNAILSKVRQHYWIIGAGTLVKSVVSKCVHCRKHQAPQKFQKMADIPGERLEMNTPPFVNVGMDYFGPFSVKRGRATVKRYGVIFTCLVSRAVHIEVAHSLDTDSNLNAIRRFVARRGLPNMIRSDNGTNLVASERILREEINKLDEEKIKGSLAVKRIRWEFNPPSASHFGGIWERLLRSIRKVLHGILHEQNVKLDDEGLSTLMCEVESILNGRPITELPNHPSDLEVLTPNHLLMLRSGEDIPPGLFSKADNYAQRRWRQIQFLADLFWHRSVKQYLPLLQERNKWQRPERNIAKGDIVLIVDDSPRNAWSLGRVLDTFKDKKGFVRSVRLKTKQNELCRPIHKLCPILEAGL